MTLITDMLNNAFKRQPKVVAMIDDVPVKDTTEETINDIEVTEESYNFNDKELYDIGEKEYENLSDINTEVISTSQFDFPLPLPTTNHHWPQRKTFYVDID